jgi:hypothetical protein
MSNHRLPTTTIAGFLAFAFASAGVSAEDVYPSKPVRIVVSPAQVSNWQILLQKSLMTLWDR